MKDLPAPDPLEFLHAFRLSEDPAGVTHQARRLLMDLCGIAQAGARTKLARIITEHAAEDFAGHLPLIGSDLTASPAGFALAGGMTIDAVDGHDGYNPAKGHIGCALLPGLRGHLAVYFFDEKVEFRRARYRVRTED